MLVSIVSECHGDAWPRSRAVLDRFLERAGERNWHGRLTQEGLDGLRSELAAVASRNMSVAAFRVEGTKRFLLEWIVGSAEPFGPDGQRSTYGGQSHDRYFTGAQTRPKDFDWLSLVVELAGLWHDVGKANADFQAKLNEGAMRADPVRHEILSCLVFLKLARAIDGKSPGDLSNEDIRAAFEAAMAEPFAFGAQDEHIDIAPADLSFPWRLVSWLVATHHRLPASDAPAANGEGALADLGLFRLSEHRKSGEPAVASLDRRILTERLVAETRRLVNRIRDTETPASLLDWRCATAYGRIALILADREVSRRDHDAGFHHGAKISPNMLLANYSEEDPEHELPRRPKQSLEEHLLKVASAAPVALSDMLDIRNEAAWLDTGGLPSSLRSRSGGRFAWQSESVDLLKNTEIPDGAGFFGQVLAGTGSGKTRACPKILAAAGDRLRYTLCLPLRSLTLQSGEEYRSDLGLGPTEVTTVIGSGAIMELFDERSANKGLPDEHNGSASGTSFGDAYATAISIGDTRSNFLKTHLPSSAGKHLHNDYASASFLATPIVVATIDQLMDVADAKRTSYIIAALRLSSSDLVIDEIDAYDAEDQVAIGRLVYFAGLYGRKVILSSATLTSGHARGLHDAYCAGFRAHAALFGTSPLIYAGFFADAPGVGKVLPCNDAQSFADADTSFRDSLLASIAQARVYRRGLICERTPIGDMDAYFARAFESAVTAHRNHAVTDPRTGKRVTSVLMRFAHISSCVAFAKWLAVNRPAGIDVRRVLYHAGFPLILRDEIEAFLDETFRRKPSDGFFKNKHIRKWLSGSTSQDNIFLLIATSVEEVGRDHDFDAAVIEPTSLHSIIQCAGRVQRHRLVETETPNVFILPTSVRGVTARDTEHFYIRPGPEGKSEVSPDPYRLKRFAESELGTDTVGIINAIPRIFPGSASPMAQLEERKIVDHMRAPSPYSLATYHSAASQAWLSNWHARNMRFRKSAPSIDAWLDPGFPGDLTANPIFYRMDEEQALSEDITCVSAPDDGLALFSLSARDILASRYSERTDTRRRWKRLCRQFLQISFTQPAQGKSLIYSDEYGFHPSIDD